MRKTIPHHSSAIYHAALRGNRGQRMFQTSADHLQFEQRLQESLDRFAAELHAYCWLSNQVHLVLRVAEAPLSQVIQHTAGWYARDYNRRHNQRRQLLQGRYRAKLVHSDSYLLAATRYIHNKPVTTGLVRDPADWRWSSHRAYLGRKPSGHLHTQLIMEHFSNNRRRYARFMQVADGRWRPDWQTEAALEPTTTPRRQTSTLGALAAGAARA